MNQIIESKDAIVRYWESNRGRNIRLNWWRNPIVHEHINKLILGYPCSGLWAGTRKLIQDQSPKGGFKSGISVACGIGSKEMQIIEDGSVAHFDCYDLSRKRIEKGREDAAKKGLTKNIDFHESDVFATNSSGKYDFVFWSHALHHMMDVSHALEWSKDCLVEGGVIVIDDYVGPTRMQYSTEVLDIQSSIRAALSSNPNFLVNPCKPGLNFPIRCSNVDPVALATKDPSECADSGRILSSIREVFPDAEIRLTGGHVYNGALDGLFGNFDISDPTHEAFLRVMMILDEQLAKQGLTQFAVAWARK
jgi:2-polyprenyl-3-methyl-5-hydroxy-6-metoxy-1,4-benzoquinol methylase